MNCGVLCVCEYLKLNGFDPEDIRKQLTERVCARGLSIQDIIEVMGNNGFECEAYYDCRVCEKYPYIMYDALYRHYYLVISCDGNYVYMYDSRLGYFRVRRWFFRLFWRKYYVSVRNSVI